MNNLNKILIFISVLSVFSSVFIVIYNKNKMEEQQKYIEKEVVLQKELMDNISRSLSQYTTKNDLENLVKESNININQIKDDLSKLNASLNSVNKVTIISNKQNNTNIPSTQVIPSNQISSEDKFNYLKNSQLLQLNENFDNSSVPIGNVEFEAWKQNPWTVNILPREYNLITILGTDENQRIYAYNQFKINVNNKDYELKITNSNIKQIFPDAKFNFWNPRLYLTTGGSINLSNIPLKASANLGVNLGIMSYGIYKNLPDISILQFGVGYQTETSKLSAIINPISFNFNKIIPNNLVVNTYFGPSVQVDTGGNIFTGINLSTGF